MFPDQTVLDLHIKRHEATNAFVCNECGKQFKQKCSLKDHLRFHIEDQQLVCDKCPSKFISKRNLKTHVASEHDVNDSKDAFKCEICEKTFYSSRGLRDHKIYHTDTEITICNFCGASCIGKRKLKAHIRCTHSEKSFACDLCPKRFASILF